MSQAQQHLAQLEAAGLVRLVHVQPEPDFAFRHALLEDVAYASLVRSDRQRMHQAVAEAMERLQTGQAPALAPALARHFELGGDAERAVRYYSLAGEEAFQRYALAEAT